MAVSITNAALSTCKDTKKKKIKIYFKTENLPIEIYF